MIKIFCDRCKTTEIFLSNFDFQELYVLAAFIQAGNPEGVEHICEECDGKELDIPRQVSQVK
ncbi:hypothetical protein KJ751_01115 [Patescibacteria group bacterium]|nr:hypothetical protein [Patescibacteria group bacterium]